MTVHTMRLGYTVFDDGVHLTCHEKGCDTDIVFPHDPTVGEVVEAFAEHQKAISKTDQGVPA